MKKYTLLFIILPILMFSTISIKAQNLGFGFKVIPQLWGDPEGQMIRTKFIVNPDNDLAVELRLGFNGDTTSTNLAMGFYLSKGIILKEDFSLNGLGGIVYKNFWGNQFILEAGAEFEYFFADYFSVSAEALLYFNVSNTMYGIGAHSFGTSVTYYIIQE